MKLTFKKFLEGKPGVGRHGENRNDQSEKTMVNRIIRTMFDGEGTDKNYARVYDFLESDHGGELWDKYYELFNEKNPSFEGPFNARRYERFAQDLRRLFNSWKRGESHKGKKVSEDVFASGGQLYAAVNDSTSRRASDDDRISTNRRPLGRMASTTRDTPVYYAFSYHSSDLTTDMLRSFKGKGPFEFPASRRNTFIAETVEHMVREFKRMKIKPDVIVTPSSSSPVVMEFATALSKGLDVEVSYIGAFQKVESFDLPADKKEALEYIKRKFIDYDYMQLKYKGDFETAENKIALEVYYNIKRNGGVFVAKDMLKQDAKFVQGFMLHSLQGDDEYNLIDKTVMVVDDILSSGTSMSEMFRIVRDELGAAEVFGSVIFSRTSAAHKEA